MIKLTIYYCYTLTAAVRNRIFSQQTDTISVGMGMQFPHKHYPLCPILASVSPRLLSGGSPLYPCVMLTFARIEKAR